MVGLNDDELRHVLTARDDVALMCRVMLVSLNRISEVLVRRADGQHPRDSIFSPGWTSMRMLDRYGHVRDSEVRRAVGTNADYLAQAQKSGATIAIEELADCQDVTDGRLHCRPVG